MKQQPPLPPSWRLPSDDDLNRLEREHGKLWTPSSGKCPTCHGKRSYSWMDYTADGAPVTLWECCCEDQYVLHRLLLMRGYGEAHMRLSWNDMTHVDPPAMDVVLKYTAKAPAYVSSGMGLVFTGPFGTGKSSLAQLLLRNLMATHGYDGQFMRFSEVISRSRQGWDSAEDQRWFMRRVRNVEVLLIDDLGSEYLKLGAQNPHEVEAANMVSELLRHRLASSSPTFITTNLDRDQLGIRYGQAVLEVFTERSIICPVPGSNYRASKAAQTAREIELGLSRPLVAF